MYVACFSPSFSLDTMVDDKAPEKSTAAGAAMVAEVAEVLQARAVAPLAPGWVRVNNIKKHKMDPTKHPKFYYANLTTGESSPIPPLASSSPSIDDDDDNAIIDVTGLNDRPIGDMRSHLAAPPRQSLEDAIAGLSEEESSDDDEEAEEEEAEKTPAQLTFTGYLPEKLYMKPKPGQKSYIEAAKSIGVYKANMTRPQIDQAVTAHFLNLHGGDVEKYFQSDCFRPDMQDIDRERKESDAKKRKKVFADKAAASGEKRLKTTRCHKKMMKDDKVCIVYYSCVMYTGTHANPHA